MSRERCLLDGLLEPGALSMVFQPIFECRGESRTLHALECLVRGPRGTNLEEPDILLEYVRRKREEARIDRACVSTALQAARELPGAPRLCLNVHGSTLGRADQFVAFLAAEASRNGIELPRLTVEIVEHAPPWDVSGFLTNLETLRGLGIRVALDDVGLGQSNYKMMLDARPDYFKIDRYFVSGSDTDARRQAVLESVTTLARKFGSQVVAEGVETAEELKTVLGQGIELIQGYVFARPSPAWAVEALLAEGPVTRSSADRPRL